MARNTLDLGSWCILRMASADTLRVAKSLSEAGLNLHVTRHAAERYLERVDPSLTFAEAIEALQSPVIRRAAAFGASYVRLGTGQRIAIEGHVVVTVLPRDQRVKCLRPRRCQTGGEGE